MLERHARYSVIGYSVVCYTFAMTLNHHAYKSKLLSERELVEKELATVGRRSPTHAGDWEPVADVEERPAERDEVADKLESFEENVAIVRQLEARLAEVQDALERIENGNYGRCTSCGGTIEAERLDANPAAKTCKQHLSKTM